MNINSLPTGLTVQLTENMFYSKKLKQHGTTIEVNETVWGVKRDKNDCSLNHCQIYILRSKNMILHFFSRKMSDHTF